MSERKIFTLEERASLDKASEYTIEYRRVGLMQPGERARCIVGEFVSIEIPHCFSYERNTEGLERVKAFVGCDRMWQGTRLGVGNDPPISHLVNTALTKGIKYQLDEFFVSWRVNQKGYKIGHSARGQEWPLSKIELFLSCFGLENPVVYHHDKILFVPRKIGSPEDRGLIITERAKGRNELWITAKEFKGEKVGVLAAYKRGRMMARQEKI